MKPVNIHSALLLLTTVMLTSNALAYEDDKKKELCRQPKIQEFTLPIYSDSNKKEVAPETEFSFVVSGWANPKKFKLTAKGKDIPFTVDSKETFHIVHAKLLPEFTGQAIRINARIPAVLDCYSIIGWLVKVASKPVAPVQPAPSTTTIPATPTTNPAPAQPATTTGEIPKPASE